MSEIPRDRAPIDQKWVQDYVDTLLGISKQMDPGPMQDAILRRVECAMDLLDAWQTRNSPRSNYP